MIICYEKGDGGVGFMHPTPGSQLVFADVDGFEEPIAIHRDRAEAAGLSVVGEVEYALPHAERIAQSDLRKKFTRIEVQIDRDNWQELSREETARLLPQCPRRWDGSPTRIGDKTYRTAVTMPRYVILDTITPFDRSIRDTLSFDPVTGYRLP